MGNREFNRRCDLEGKFVPCKIAQGSGACRQVIECIDASVLTTNDLTPEEFCQKFPGTTIDQAIRLRSRRLELMPDLKDPFSQFVNNVCAVPAAYRENFVRRALMGILPRETAIEIKLNPPKSIPNPLDG